MAVTFTPKSEDELERELLIPDGEYDFQISAAEQKVSKSSGNDMFEMKVVVFHEHGQRTIMDYIVFGNAWGQKKLIRLCKATGIESVYASGRLEAFDLEGHTGRCKVETQEGQNGYGPKNIIQDYIVSAGAQVTTVSPQYTQSVQAREPVAATVTKDDLPF